MSVTMNLDDGSVEISTGGGLCPSNTMVKGEGFPNYAGRNDVDELLIQELKDAGLGVTMYPECIYKKREVDSRVCGEINADDMPRIGWFFQRAWYYWVAKGPGVPPDYAEKLHKTHGHEVRVEGHCGCPSPLEYNKGFGVGSYHIDTSEGLKAFVDMLKQIMIDAQNKLKSA